MGGRESWSRACKIRKCGKMLANESMGLGRNCAGKKSYLGYTNVEFAI